MRRLQSTRRVLLTLSALLTAVLALAAEKKYGPGVSDAEIKIGQTAPYSGPVSAYGTMGKAMPGYFAQVNDEGGVNGRKVRLLSLDDAFTPPKTVEQTRKLVEQENVLLIFGTIGTPGNSAIYKYLNAQKDRPVARRNVAWVERSATQGCSRFPGLRSASSRLRFLTTGASDYFPIKQLQLVRFDGSRWVPFGDLIGQ